MSGEPPHLNETRQWRIVQAIRELFEGRSNAVGSVTLTANDTTTVVSNVVSNADSKIFLMPTTANAQADWIAGMRVSAKAQGSFTITHPNNANADKTFDWVALG